MSTDRPQVRRSSAFKPPAEVAKVIEQRKPPAAARRNPKAKPVQVQAPQLPALQVVKPAVPAPARAKGDAFLETQQDVVDIIYALTEGHEAAQANVQRWAQKGDAPRMEAALMQAQRCDVLRQRAAAFLQTVTRKG